MLLEQLHSRTGVSLGTLEALAASASKRYKVYTIPKRDGSPREICHPSKTLKAVQRWLVRGLLNHLPVHDCATAYEKNRSIVDNAQRHADSIFTIRVDFSDFFGSFDIQSILQYLRNSPEIVSFDLTEVDLSFATRIFCRNGRLTIGAPSSPKITNIMMFQFDSIMSDYANRNNLVYTRYADDIFISSYKKNQIKDAELFIREQILRHQLPKLCINEKKTIHLSRSGHRSVTGLVITPDGDVSLGRSRKREIKTLIYLSLNHKLDDLQQSRLIGLIAFARDVEPSFIDAMSKKFEIDVTKLS